MTDYSKTLKPEQLKKVFEAMPPATSRQVQQQYDAWARQELAQKKHDQIFDAAQFSEHNKMILMTLEIEELIEAGKIDYVHSDNVHSQDEVGIHELEVTGSDGKPTTVNILCLGVNVRYSVWRAFYNSLLKEK